jgi:integrase
VLDGVWRPALGKHLFHQVRYSHLVRASDWQHWSKKTYNNAISVIRRAFEFGYRDHPELPNPAAGLRTVRLKRQDRPKIDPFNIQDAETLIGALHRDWGATQGNYEEFRFFTGLRPSEQIALMLSDIDLKQGVVSVNKACVAGIDRDCTKTGEDRCVHRKPYCARHSSVSWNLMVGKNPLWVAKQHGHSVTTMFRVYTAWAEGALEADIQAIKRAMKRRPAPAHDQNGADPVSRRQISRPVRHRPKDPAGQWPPITRPPRRARAPKPVWLQIWQQLLDQKRKRLNSREKLKWKGRDSKTPAL